MLYYSLNHNAPEANFKDATIRGLAPDDGLYFPSFIPPLSKGWINELKTTSNEQIAFDVMRPFIGDVIPEEELFRICSETVDMDFPLHRVSEGNFSLELFHGPTLTFKDTGARFMSRCLAYFSRDNRKRLTVLVATSGDTGCAVANEFLGVEGAEVVVLYPSGKVNPMQELQLTTLGGNVTALEIKGSFYDCQHMVKQAFADSDLQKVMLLTSANSINVARWLPQQFYYFYAHKQWPFEYPPVISVPSGNLGNICAGLLAHVRGLPVMHFIAGCNSNRSFTDYLSRGQFVPAQALVTISNAMDVGNPCNFVRILELFDHNHFQITKLISSFSINDHVTAEAIWDVFKKDGYLMDPHGAVAYCALRSYQEQQAGFGGIFLATAHPCKFREMIESIIGKFIEIPESQGSVLGRKKNSVLMKPGFDNLKEFLLDRK
jgi:threonine synthase